jgi:hypothetical protein
MPVLITLPLSPSQDRAAMERCATQKGLCLLRHSANSAAAATSRTRWRRVPPNLIILAVKERESGPRYKRCMQTSAAPLAVSSSCAPQKRVRQNGERDVLCLHTLSNRLAVQ